MNANFIREQIERYTGKITPGKALVALAVVYIAVRVLGAILGLFDAVLPFVFLGILAYFGYQFLQSSNPAAEQIRSSLQNVTTRKSAAEDVSADVIERVTRRAAAPVEVPAQTRTTPTAADVSADVVAEAESPKIETVNVLADESAETTVDEVPAATKMQVAEKVNPKTGLREPDLARLEEREKEKPNQDNVLSQLEERKKRLKGG